MLVHFARAPPNAVATLLALSACALRAPAPVLSFNDIVEKDFNDNVERELAEGSEATRARLVICVNTNICGKKNPTHNFGYGFAWTAIDCIRTLGPPWLEVRSGPCFIRCSRGVNARLIGNKRAADAAGEAAVRSRDLFRLNSVDLCVDMLREDLEWDVEPNLLAAYHAFAEAQVLMDDTFARLEGVSLPARAGEALSLLDKAAAYVSATLSVAGGAEGAGRVAELQPAAALAAVVADATRARRSWAGSVWRESFYGSELSFVSFAPAAEGAAEGAAEVLGKYGQKVYGIGNVGGIRAVTSSDGQGGRELRGTWREEPLDSNGQLAREAKPSGGEVTLVMSEDGLSFHGAARLGASADSELVEWRGDRIPQPAALQEAAERESTPQQRWGSAVMELSSRARLRLRQQDEAMLDGIEAVRLCRYRPEAWEALVEVAEAVGDTRTTAIALTELLYLQSPTAPNLPTEVANRRREQGFKLERIRAGGGGVGGGGSAFLQSMKRSNRRGGLAAAGGGGGGARAASGAGEESEQASVTAGAAAAARDPDEERRAAIAEAIFVDEYAIGGE